MGRQVPKIIVCPECGKPFIRNTQSLYVLKINGKTVRYCSYKCWKINDKRRYSYERGSYKR